MRRFEVEINNITTLETGDLEWEPEIDQAINKTEGTIREMKQSLVKMTENMQTLRKEAEERSDPEVEPEEIAGISLGSFATVAWLIWCGVRLWHKCRPTVY